MLLASLCLAGHAQAQPARDTLIVGYVDVPPMAFRGEDGRAQGEFIELTRRVAEEAGYDLDFRFLPVSRAYHYLRTGGIDIWPGVTDVPALENEVLESFVSPFPFQLSAWAMNGSSPVRHFNDLHNKTLILISGYTYGGLAARLESPPGITVTEAPNHQAAVAMLERGRGDYLLDYQDPVRVVLQNSSVRGIREYPVRVRNAAWIFSLANPRSSELRDEFDDAYLRLADRGEAPPPRALSEGFLLPGLSD
ncbi:transporter substrate-binding domain-containing protein [Marinobacter sp. TBZ242]|uniref:Transporter substrate-binding domain-containing protein n=1 Tax=Marinobacter azerbaijanicus TaxID=3050455 RepID=A0ABT7IFF4_9GAMM|nr:transporter substrate-binding domain-containing protein [Marinobacter sp. TBZ242]MDL0432901.1 transporter substrate-binding domain-containing protein [Marinobacter sp. TBZ242]